MDINHILNCEEIEEIGGLRKLAVEVIDVLEGTGNFFGAVQVFVRLLQEEWHARRALTHASIEVFQTR